MNVNLACGSVYLTDTAWLNLDYASSSPAVQRANLLGRLPLADATADLVYSSHFLDHIPREHVAPFLQECYRIRKPGGVLRLVVPDLENLCRTYLHHRDQGEHDKADFVVLELLDQCVRQGPLEVCPSSPGVRHPALVWCAVYARISWSQPTSQGVVEIPWGAQPRRSRG